MSSSFVLTANTMPMALQRHAQQPIIKMKKTFLLLAFACVCTLVQAQTNFKYGYLSFTTALKAMPDYAAAERNLADLKAKYKAEAQRVEDEFNKKYELFLDGQRTFPLPILRKRQAEIQELLEKNAAFAAESKRLLEQAEQDAKAPVLARLRTILNRIGTDRGYAFILNTDNDAVPFVNKAMGEDINALVKDIVNRQQ